MLDASPIQTLQRPEVTPAMAKIIQLTQAQNLAGTLVKGDKLAKLGETVVTEYEIDRKSMSDWLDQAERGKKLATLAKSDKNYPFENASNVRFPLLASSVLQFNARAYPAVVSRDQIVKAKVHGDDRNKGKAARAARVAEYMSYQLRKEVQEWAEETDKLTATLPLAGTVTRKIWYDTARKRLRVRTCAADGFIVHNNVKTLQNAPRVAERLSLYPSEIAERVASKDWLNTDLPDDSENKEGQPAPDAQDSSKPREFIEQHRRIDLDGDGYPEPYVVTVHKSSRTVMRIVADFQIKDVRFGDKGARILSIARGEYFVPYHFLPSMDGSFLSLGYGLLLGDISETIDTILNMLIDAGHMAAMGGGFIGSDAKMKGGSHNRRPGEWTKMPVRGSAIRESLVELTFPGPDATLFQVLGMLIEEARRLSGVSEVMTGEASRANEPATSMLARIEQGLQQFTAAYQRIFRAFEQEFALIAQINAEHLDAETYSAFFDRYKEPEPVLDEQGQQIIGNDGQPLWKDPEPVMYDPAADFDLSDMDISPIADPDSVTNMQKLAKAELVKAMAAEGMADPEAAAQRIFEAAAIPEPEELAPKPPSPEQVQRAEMMEQLAVEDAAAEVDAKRAKAAKDMKDAQPEVEDGARLQMEASEKAAKLQQEGEIAYARLAQDRELGLLKMEIDAEQKALDRTAKTDDALVAAGLPPGYSFEADREQMGELMGQMRASGDLTSQAIAALAQGQADQADAIRALAATMAAPIDVKRDASGEVVGAERVLQ